MTRRPLRIATAALLFAGLALFTACKKKTTDTGGENPSGGPGPGAPPAVNSDHLLFAQFKVKDVLDSALFADVKRAIEKQGAGNWEAAEAEIAKNTGGLKPTDFDALSVFLPDFPKDGAPKFILVLAANKPLKKDGAFGLTPQSKPDSRGFYQQKDVLLHFPDDKTLVVLHPDLAQKYLGGYAKDRGGWPMTADLKAAAASHTLFASVNLEKIPREMLNDPKAQQFAPLLAARSVTLTADLKGREISAAARATFPDAAAAGKAKEAVQGFVTMASSMVDQFATSKEASDLGPFMPAVKETQRALKAVTIEVSGNDLTVAGSYKIDFDLPAMLVSAVGKVREAAARMADSNNLKQIGLAMHNYADANLGTLPVHAVGAKGLPLKNATDKPLLSWRVAILPYVEQQALYNQFKLDEPWDSENNKKLIDKMPKLFAPPATKPGKPGYTHFQMVIGPNAMQPIGTRMPASFPDGTSNTIAVVEAAEPVIWTKPDDVMLPGKELPKDFRKKFGGLHPGGFQVALWDGSVRFISDAMSDRTLGAALDPKDGLPLGSDW
jgi:hypothetical protein